jgi:hypothetical protein
MMITFNRRMLGGLVVAMILAGCASGPSIVTNSAPDFNVANYKTFGFMQPLGTDQGSVRSITSTHLIDAATRELELSGLKRVDSNPDLLVNFQGSTRETLQTRNVPATGASMHYGHGRYGYWGGYSMSMSTTEVVQRTEGTIAVHLVDAAANQLVWEGAATGRVTDSVRRDLENALNGAIADIFAEFP